MHNPTRSVAAHVRYVQPWQVYALSRLDGNERMLYYLYFLGFMTFYLRDYLHFDPAKSAFLTGFGMVAAYAGPALLSSVSDFIGKRISVVIGSFLLSMAYFTYSMGTVNSYYAGTLLLAIGTGLFKGPMAGLVGGHYTPGDPRRDQGFGLYYKWVNWGALASPFITAAGMAGALSAFHKNGYLALFRFGGYCMLITVVGLIVCYRGLAAADRKIELGNIKILEPGMQAKRHWLVVEAAVLMAFFWMGFHQNAIAFPLWAESNIDRTFGGVFGTWTGIWGLIKNGQIHPVLFGAFNSMFIVLFTDPVDKVLTRFGISTPGKLGIGMVVTAISFLILAIPSYLHGDALIVSALWLIGTQAILTVGELCVSPIGLSMVTKLAARKWVGAFIGIWYAGTAAGNYACGKAGSHWTTMPHWQFWLLFAVPCLLAALYVAFRLKKWKQIMPSEASSAPAPLDGHLAPDSQMRPVHVIDIQAAA